MTTYNGRCECGRRHAYYGSGVYIKNSDDLLLDNPIDCGCGRVLYIYGADRGKTFFGDDNSGPVYMREKRNVPRIHENRNREYTEQEKRSKYWQAQDQRDANDRYLKRREVNQDKMEEAQCPDEYNSSTSDHPVREGFGVLATIAFGLLAAIYVWSLLLH